jgi:hypothetical protein
MMLKEQQLLHNVYLLILVIKPPQSLFLAEDMSLFLAEDIVHP